MMRFRCKYCYYYGKTCNGGSGRIAAILFKQGATEDFPKYAKYVAPLFLLWLVPVFVGIVVLAFDFAVSSAVLLILFIILSFGLSNQIQKKLCCHFCRQQDDCTIYQLMHKPRESHAR